ncbi:hypothetical protein FDV58_17625 [Bradyrhizobium elkanii]|uniref:Uncharacterized protein n=1 Tax=Bradyrhizobium elkanii TaxID=29448 RepID=A0A4U6RXZ2_BRAEL|nr:hypothetical protein [Bradyrhizobium elkanii]TKV80074.1 hypothetical protein FDV58_17625 [Bradyrhizobium elkanii]
MDVVQAIILREPWEVTPRLQELALPKNKLLEVRDIAVHERANATAFHAANAPGTFSYHHGIWALRHHFVGADWRVDRTNGVETIRNDRLNLVVSFCNVDLACVDAHTPQPRTKKGSGVERASGPGLFVHLPHYAPRPIGKWQFFYLMVDENGAAELSRPVVKGGTFSAVIERIYLSHGSDDDGTGLLQDTPDAPVEFDPQIARKV